MIEKFRKEELLNIKQVNDLLKKLGVSKVEEEKKCKWKVWALVAVGAVVIAAGAFALYKLLAPNEFEDFEEDDFEEFEEFEEEDFEDAEYEDESNDESNAQEEEASETSTETEEATTEEA